DEIQAFNPAAEKIFGYAQREVLGKSVRMLMPEFFHEDGERLVGMTGTEVMAIRKNGEPFPAELSISEMILSGRHYFIGIVRDITERKAAEQKILHLAHHDYLTDLPNRALFLDRLDQAIELGKRSGSKIAVLFIDLDGFKLVNDNLGHDMGDLLLQSVALRLADIVRSSDTVARVGGDEFTLVLSQVGEKRDASLVAEKIIVALSEPFCLQGEQCHIGGSIGIAVFPDDADDSRMLLKHADEAMYFAKQGGKNGYRFYRVPEEASETVN
ncbi:MAG TPA: sensor domain-containing diguanylate cyclase, partial [Burkholderiales bacterium]|nr:sensor domain-containing diguanylate cyclase [Burkholderiales bacterium]